MGQIDPDLPEEFGDVNAWGGILNAAFDEVVGQGNASDEAISHFTLARYTSAAELNAIRTEQVGLLDVANMQTEFPGLPFTLELPTGPARLFITSRLMAFTADPSKSVLSQSMVATNTSMIAFTMSRSIYFDPANPDVPILPGTWEAMSFVPGGATNTMVLSAFGNGAPRWQPWTTIATANAFMRRDSAGRAQVATPSAAADIATKGYVDGSQWQTFPPVTASSSGVAGARAYDANYIYVCVATNTWRRAPLASW